MSITCSLLVDPLTPQKKHELRDRGLGPNSSKTACSGPYSHTQELTTIDVCSALRTTLAVKSFVFSND